MTKCLIKVKNISVPKFLLLLLFLVEVSLASVADSKVLMNEEFSDYENINNWYIDTNKDVWMNIRKGRYEFRHNHNEGVWEEYKSFDLDEKDNYEIKASMLHLSGVSDHGYGLMFGAKDINNGLFFNITANGYYRIYKTVNGKRFDYVKYTKDKIVNRRESVLKIKKVNSAFYFFINDKLCKELQIKEFYGNNIGFVVAGKQEISFDNFKVTKYFGNDIPLDNYVRLTVAAPKDSQIKVLNINAKYKDKLLLKKGKYHIQVSKKGYEKYDKWLEVNKNTNLNIELTKYKKRKPTEATVLANGNIEWKDEKYYKNTFEKLKVLNGLVWTTDHWNGNWYKAKKLCSNLTINSGGLVFDKFKVPLMSELKSLYNSGSLRFGAYYASYWSLEKQKGVHSDRDALTHDINRGSGDSSNMKRSNNNIRCVLSIDFFNNYSINAIANKLYNFNIKNSSKLSLPERPEKKEYKKLVKDEFETTKQFNNRVEEAKRIIDLENNNNLKNWNEQILNKTQNHQIKIKSIESNKNEKYLQYLQAAMHVKYGNPKISAVNYSADNQLFDVILKSDKGTYEEKVKIPVKLKYAKKFKHILIDKNFKPTIEYEVLDGKLLFTGIKEIKDPEILVEKNEYSKVYNSISGLNGFIYKYPQSTLLSNANARILVLNEEKRLKEEKERLNREKRERENREIEIRREKAKKRKQDSYYSRKRVGDKVCIDSNGLFSETVKGYVERVNDSKMQIRITDGSSFNNDFSYNTLRWDHNSDWYKCDY